MRAQEVYIAAIGHFGMEKQKIKALEELSKLQAEIARDLNWGAKDIEHTIKEIADAWIMIQQMAHIYGEKAVIAMIQERTNYLEKIINGEIEYDG